jgi:NAD(P)-dependent dehydrogenase (short-subunit alcohol dehydrogenase family)
VKLDTTNESDIAHAVKHVESVLGSRGLDVLINNAGVMPITPGDVQAMTDLDEVMRTNVTSVQMVTSAFLPLVSKGREKKVFNM